MREINFIPTKEKELFVYRLFYDHFHNPLVEKNWDGIFRTEFYENSPKSPYLNFAINNNFHEDNIILTTIILELLKSKTTFAIPSYYRDEAKEILKRDFEFVKWEYDTEFEHGMVVPIDNGFVKGRSCIPIIPEPSEWQKINKDFAGLFSIEKYSDIVGLELATFGDATSEVTFFGLNPNRKLDLAENLNGAERPELDKLLTQDDIFIDLLIGHDHGYYNCISIKTKRDISEKIKVLTEDLFIKGRQYEENIPSIRDIDDFFDEMKKINGC